MKITSYEILPGMKIQPALPTREWMDKTEQKYAYRCLPLTIANSYGWEMINDQTFSVMWDGTDGISGIKIRRESNRTDLPPPVVSHFGYGIVTFHIPKLFRTPTGVDLFVTGPLNKPKHGLYALTGIVETDWSMATFTMNWKFTSVNEPIRFYEGEPICHIFPVQRGYIENFEAEEMPIEENPEVKKAYEDWSESRRNFTEKLSVPESEEAKQGWQKHYFKGIHPTDKVEDHKTKVRVREFKKKK